jgi:hypothetical protein
MSFRKRTGTYPVRNKNQAVVGALIGNGISLDISGDISEALICIGYRLDLESTWKNEQRDYPVVDFATANDELTTLLPVGITDNIGVIDGMICADVHPQVSANYFPIIRSSNWIDTTNNPFYPETIQVVSLNLTATITTLDVHFSSLFLVVTLYGLFDISVMIYQIFKKIMPKTPVLLMVLFITLCNLLRCVYFFITPAQYASDAIDYALVGLPTFMYFTAFSLIVANW